MAARPPRAADDNVGMIDLVGDLADQVRRLAAQVAVLGNAAPAAQQAAFQAEVAGVQAANEPTLQLAERLGNRAENKRAPAALTTLPAAWGIQDLNHQHLRSMEKYSGDLNDRTHTIYTWLASCVSMATHNQYTQAAFIGALELMSTGGVYAYLKRQREAGVQDAATLVQGLESRYGSPLTAEDAKTKMGNLVRNMQEPVSAFTDQLWTYAAIAERERAAGPEKTAAIEAHVRQHVLRTLDVNIQKAVTDRLDQYVTHNAVPMSFNELESLILKLEQDRADRRKQDKLRQLQVQAAQVQAAVVAETEGLEDDLLVNVMVEQNRRDREKGRAPQAGKAVAAAIKSWNNRLQQTSPAGAGPPEALDERRRAVLELLALANCDKGECLQCGRKGHIKGNLKCPLRGKPLTDRACMMCGKGLHNAADCAAHHLGPTAALDQVGGEGSEDLNGQ